MSWSDRERSCAVVLCSLRGSAGAIFGFSNLPGLPGRSESGRCSTEPSLEAGRDPEASEPWKFERGAPDVEAQHGAEEIQLESFHPADGHANVAGERHEDAGAGSPSGVGRLVGLG